MISRMDYAVDVLLPLIPEALRSGTGPTHIRRIRRLENACRDLWTEHRQTPEAFTVVFGDVLAMHDGPNWELDAAQLELETRIAERLVRSLKEVRLEVDARLARGTEERSSAQMTATTASVPIMPTSHPRDGTNSPPADAREYKDTNPGDSQSAKGSDSANSSRDESSTSMSTRSPPTTCDIATAATSPSSSHHDGPSDLKSLRSRCYVLALKIAKRHDLEDCLYAAGKLGMGFLIDIPREAIIPVAGREDAVPQLFRQWLWWLLLSLSEEVVDPERMALAPDEILLRNLILEHNDAKALALVGEPDWKALGYELMSNPTVPDETSDDLLALMQTCRRIRRLAEDTVGATLWKADG